jgi:hypothetical protein
MKHSNLFKSIAGGALLLAVLGLAYGLSRSRAGTSEIQASLEQTHTARPARLAIATDDHPPFPSLGSIHGTPTRADVREPGALHVIAQPELQSQIRVIDSPGRTEPKSRPSTSLGLSDSFASSGDEYKAPPSNAPTLVTTFAGPDFDDNPIVNGEGRIPPDPKGAVGQNHVVATVNEIIEIRQKNGTLDDQGDLDSFLINLGYTPLAFTFDSKVTYDPFEDRFVVLVLGVSDIDLDGTPTNESSIFIAVSDDGDPNGAWCSTEIDSKIDLGGSVFTWADYPGLVVDEEAVYVTASLFQYHSQDPTFAFGGIRLWTLDKGTIGGLYDCDTADVNLFDPYSGTNLNQQAALQPAAVVGIAPTGVGTFLIGYSGTTLDTGGNGSNSELQQVIRVDDPLGSATFTKVLVDLGNIEDLSAAPELPNASQSGSAVAIETNDRATLSGFWWGNSLYTAQSINPTGTVFPGNNGQATAYWSRIETSDLNNLARSDHGVIGGEDIAAGTHTFFPSISPVVGGFVAIGFAASGAGIHPGAYFTWRSSEDAAGTNRGSVVLHAGDDIYVRTRKGNDDPNRWGDWSDTMFDPFEFGCFWVFNQYAMTKGSPTNTGNDDSQEDGRWATEWGNYCITEDPILWDGFESGDTSAWSVTRP